MQVYRSKDVVKLQELWQQLSPQRTDSPSSAAGMSIGISIFTINICSVIQSATYNMAILTPKSEFNGKNIKMVTYFLVVLRIWMVLIHLQCIALEHMDSYNCSLTDERWSISWWILFTMDVL